MIQPLVTSYFAAAPDLAEPNGRAEAWVTDPPGMLTRTRVPTLDVATATFLARDADKLLRATPGGPYILIHDFSSIRSYESGARRIMTDWGKALGRRLKLVRVRIADDAPRLVHMGLSVTCAALVVLGLDIRPARDLESTLRELGVRARHVR